MVTRTLVLEDPADMTSYSDMLIVGSTLSICFFFLVVCVSSFLVSYKCCRKESPTAFLTSKEIAEGNLESTL
ncbi:hypothetical protein C0J52_09430 [Blattella germanica]|nr:hypothetical protein C0J52_09430 [Blattella germanica]